ETKEQPVFASCRQTSPSPCFRKVSRPASQPLHDDAPPCPLRKKTAHCHLDPRLQCFPRSTSRMRNVSVVAPSLQPRLQRLHHSWLPNRRGLLQSAHRPCLFCAAPPLSPSP